MLGRITEDYRRIVTVEDGCTKGGLFGAVSEFITPLGLGNKVTALGIPDRFIGQGTQKELRAECGYDAEGIYRTLKAEMEKKF